MRLKKIVSVLVISTWLISGLYFGIGGLVRAKMDETLKDLDSRKETLIQEKVRVSYDGIEFENSYELLSFLEVNNIEYLFPWAIKISSFVSLIITAFSFGLIGSIIALLKDIAFTEIPLENLRIWSLPVLGILTGLVVMGLSYLLPTILIKNSTGLQPITLMFICLFAGIHTENFFNKISEYFKKLFE